MYKNNTTNSKINSSNNLMIVTGSLNAGGLERIVSNLANYYADKGWNVRIVLLLSPEVFYKLNPSIEVVSFTDVRIKGKLSTAPKWIKFVKKNIDEFFPKSIVAMTFKIGAITRIACKNKNIRIIVREINDPSIQSQFMNRISDYFVGKCDGIIFQTNWERICHSKKCQKIGHIIVNPVIIPIQATFPKRKVIFTTSRLVIAQKSQDELIKAFKIVHESYPDYKLEIYGDGPDRVFLEKVVTDLELDNYVVFMGMKSNVHECVKDAEIFALTSKYEGLSNSLLESFLMGIPCITSDWHGAEEIIDNGIDGIIYKRNDINALADAIKFYIENKEVALSYANKAIKKRNKYSLDKVICQWESIIEDFD